MAFTSDGLVGFTHIDMHTWEVRLVSSVWAEQLSDFLIDVVGNSSILDWLNSLVNVQLNLYIFQVANAIKYVIVLFTEFRVTISCFHWSCFTHIVYFADCGDLPKLQGCIRRLPFPLASHIHCALNCHLISFDLRVECSENIHRVLRIRDDRVVFLGETWTLF